MYPYADRCFCGNSEPGCGIKVIQKKKYILSTGFYRYGIKIRDKYLKNKIKVYDWNVAYHLTKVE